MSDWTLGQRVTVLEADRLSRQMNYEAGRGDERVWLSWRDRQGDAPEWMGGPIEGIVVGLRSLANGTVTYGDFGGAFKATERFPAVMVVTDLRKKPGLYRVEAVTR